MNGVQWMYLSKWLIFVLLIITAWVPGLILSGLISNSGLALYYFATVSVSGLMIWRQISDEQMFYVQNTVKFIPRNRAQQRLQRIISRTNAKFLIHSLQTQIMHPDASVHLSAASMGWPFKARLLISDALFKRFQRGMNEGVIEAWLAHEMSHIQAHDTLFNIFSVICKNMLLVQLIGLLIFTSVLVTFSNFAIFSSILVANQTVLARSLLSCYAMIFVCSLLMAQLSRIQEYLADNKTLLVTRKPQATIDFLYEKFYQYLKDGLLVTENKFAAEKRVHFTHRKDKKKLRKYYKDLNIESRDRVYERIKNVRRNYKQSIGLEKKANYFCKPLLSYWHYTQTWFNGHPRCTQRKQFIQTQARRLNWNKL